MKQQLSASMTIAGDPSTIRKGVLAELLGGTKSLTLRVPLANLSVSGDFAVSKKVAVTTRLIQYSANMPDDLQIEFEASPPNALFPTFLGVFDFQPAKEAGQSVLEIKGSYEAPLGLVGAVLDAAVGHRIAHRTLVEFLNEIVALCAAQSPVTV